MLKKNKENKILFLIINIIFLVFLIFPVIVLLSKSFINKGVIGFENYKNIILSESFIQCLKNSFVVSICTAVLTTFIAFILVYSINNLSLIHIFSSFRRVYTNSFNSFTWISFNVHI